MPHHLAVTVFNTQNEWMKGNREKHTWREMEGDKVCAFKMNSIVASSAFTLLLCQIATVTTKKIETKMGIFFKEAALRTCPINLDTASGVERTHWVFLWVWKTCQNSTRKIPRKSSGYTESFPIVVEHTQWTALLVHMADSVLNQYLAVQNIQKKSKPCPISSKWCYSWAYFQLCWR